jgi:hypothetical protein
MAEKKGGTDESINTPFDEDGLAEGWPDAVRNTGAKLFAYDLDEVRGRDRLGDLAFNEVPDLVTSIRATLGDLAHEPWEELPSELANALTEKVEAVCSKLDQMVELSATSENAANKRNRFVQQLSEMDNWLRKEIRPQAVQARVKRALADQAVADSPDKDMEAVRESLSQLHAEASAINKELDSRKEALDQARADAGESAGEELAEVFSSRANCHKNTAERWLVALVLSGPLAVGFAVLTFFWLRPDQGSNDPHDFAGIGLAIFILGVLAFGIRICAQNYRVNRHLEAVARSRASAISTFQRLAASASDPEIRSAVTLTLAQSIFATEDTGLVDGSGDHVTLVERAAVPLLSRSDGRGTG